MQNKVPSPDVSNIELLDELPSSAINISSQTPVPAHTSSGFMPVFEYERPCVGLALSGGGARGLAAIGMLQVFEEENIPVDLVIGSSMGAVIAGLYGVGYSPEELENITENVDWGDLFSDSPRRRNLFLAQKENANQELLTIRFKGLSPYIPDAFVTGETLFLRVLELILRSPSGAVFGSFDDITVPVGLVATDLLTAQKVVMRDGDLPLSIRATMAIPIVFRPLRYDGKLLVDGGAIENIPVRAAQDAGADIVVAFDCSSPRVPDLDPDSPWEIANQVTTLMTMSNDSISRAMADLVVSPNLDEIAQTDFDNTKAIIQAGRDAAEIALPKIRTIIGEISPVPDRTHWINNIVIGALPVTRREEISIITGLKQGKWSNREINRGLGKLLRHLHEIGYGAAKINTVTIEDSTLLIAIDPGVVREIRIEGVPVLRQGMVMREVRVKMGQPFNNKELLKTITQLHATGRYTVVYSYLKQHPDDGVILTLLLEEAPFPMLGVGMGFDSERQARYFAELTIKSGLLREGEELTLRGKYGIRDKEYDIKLRADRLASTYLGWRIKGAYQEREQDIFQSESDGNIQRVADVYNVNAELITLFNIYTWGELSAGIKSEWVKHHISEVWNSMNLNATVLEAMLDTEDKKPFPNSGTRIGIRYESYIDYLLSDRAFNTVEFEAELVQTVLPRNVARIAWKSGVADLTTPASHRFRLGGINNFPSFPPDRFMALRRMTGTFEWRYDLISRYVAEAYLIGRYDLAAFSDAESWRPKTEDLIHSYSAGFALDTFLGPMEIWYAYKPKSQSIPETNRFIANLGYRF
ncbi:MAG: patatin-like phospholipase family protein [Candidatus Electryonea clarkiae]|nr:patatin-like phospholipase family protein [Candidatus Electryonea clarkiae]MDP8285859.1 patatin-like phospholipase family protein [Candidatus Electryonea clarkiae]